MIIESQKISVTAKDANRAPEAILVRGLCHTYRAPQARGHPYRRHKPDRPQEVPTHRPALDGIDLEIPAGDIFGILGPNGSGKTTLFRVLSTLLRPTAGRLSVFGYDVIRQAHQVRRQLGVVFQMPGLDLKLTAAENLAYQGRLYGLSDSDLRQRIDALLADVGLADRRDEYVERFSGGMRRRVELAKSMLHRPRLLLLDEPATGLDPGVRRDMWETLRRLRGDHGVTVVLTTHLMEEADQCDQLAILAEGKLVARGGPSELKSRIGGDVICLDPADPTDLEPLCQSVAGQFGPWPDGSEPVISDGKIHLEHTNGPAFVSTLASALAGRARTISVGKPTLEDVFLHLTGHTLWKNRDQH